MQKTICIRPCCSSVWHCGHFILNFLCTFRSIFLITLDSCYCIWKVVYFLFSPQGLKSEGLYRISGFSDSVEEVKMGFDKGLSSKFQRRLSTHTMTGEALHPLICPKELGALRINEKLTHLWRISAHLGIRIQSWHLPLTQDFIVWTDGGAQGLWTMDVLSLPQTLHCWDSVVDLVRINLSCLKPEWILTVGKSLQQWTELWARSAWRRSSMTECHSSSQRCDVQSASTSRPWSPLESIHNRESQN